MKTRIFLLTFAVILVLSGAVAGQKLVSVQSNGYLPPKAVNDFLKKNKIADRTTASAANIDLRKVTYTSTDENGSAVELTGLLAMPKGHAPKGLVVFMHGTIWDRKSSPSRVGPKGGHAEPMGAISVFCPSGYAVIMPDYLGLGDNKRVHPYPMNVVNAVAGADIIAPARQVMKDIGYTAGSDLFVTGYSEGGGTAMALTRLLQEKKVHAVTASAPASGPYDLTGVTRDYLLEEASGKDLIARAYLLGYTISYFESVKGVKTADYFTPRMARAVDLGFKDGTSDESILFRLALVGTFTGGTRSVEKLLTPRFITALEKLDQSDPVIAGLSSNDVYNWSTTTPMLLINLSTDRVVDPRNSDKAYNTMRNRGVTPNLLKRLVIRNEKLDHLTAFPPALIGAREFFDKGFIGVRGIEP